MKRHLKIFILHFAALLLMAAAAMVYAGGSCGGHGGGSPGPGVSAGPPGGGPGYSNYRDWAKLVDGYGVQINKAAHKKVVKKKKKVGVAACQCKLGKEL